MSTFKICLYHQNCNDGFVAAHAVWEKDKDNTLCIPITYHEFDKQTPDEFLESCFSDKIVSACVMSDFKGSISHLLSVAKTEVTVYLVDISVPKPILLKISEIFKWVIVLDHHESADKIYKYDPDFEHFAITDTLDLYTINKNVKICMDKVNSGAMVTWLYMNPDKTEVPRAIKLVSDYDTWKKEDKNADYFAAGLRYLNCRKFSELTMALIDVKGTIKSGYIAEKIREDRTNSVVKHRIDVTINYRGEEYKAAIVNSSMDISSILGNTLVSEHGYDVGMTYCITKDGDVAWSIRSKKPFSCLFVAEAFGGGGHAQACGFATSVGYLVDVIQTKHICI